MCTFPVKKSNYIVFRKNVTNFLIYIKGDYL